jgi:hypothetical protein
MTEYEIADLAASKAFELQGQVSLLQVQSTTVSDAIQQFMYALFAFLVATYFVGASLNRRQVWIFTGLYTLWQIHTMFILGTRLFVLIKISEDLAKLFDSPQPLLGWLPLALSGSSVFLLTIALIASIYFMWSVKHPKTE